MNLRLIALLATFAFCNGDVAHLQRNYLPPSRTVAFEQSGYNGRLTQATAERNYYSPNSASYTAAYRTGFAAPARFTQNAAGFVQNTGGFAQNTGGFAAKQFSSAQFSAPSRQYLSPEVETFEPITVQQSYTAPVLSYSSPAVTTQFSGSGLNSAYTGGASADFGTRYAANGGYEY